MEKFLGLTRQCTYLQLEKPSGIGIETPIHKRLAINLLDGVAKRTYPSGLIGLRYFSFRVLWFLQNSGHPGSERYLVFLAIESHHIFFSSYLILMHRFKLPHSAAMWSGCHCFGFLNEDLRSKNI